MLTPHLYNAFWVKRHENTNHQRLIGHSQQSTAEPAAKRQKTALVDGHDKQPEENAHQGYSDSESEGGDPTDPNKRRFIGPQWTAWPLPPELVPTENDHLPVREYDDYAIPKVRPKRRPAEFLKDCITAEFQRQAKLKLREEGKELMDDEDKAAQLLRPMVESVVSKLDGLFEGLVLDRARYAKLAINGIRGETRKRREEEREESPHSQPENDGNSNSDSDSEYPKPNKLKRPRPDPNTAEYHSRRLRRLKPRDWSQVLGVAQFRGVGNETVQRAAQRCGEIFGQNMTWRTLSEGSTKPEGRVWSSFEGDSNSVSVSASASASASGSASASASASANVSTNVSEAEDRRPGADPGAFLEEITFSRRWERRVKQYKMQRGELQEKRRSQSRNWKDIEAQALRYAEKDSEDTEAGSETDGEDHEEGGEDEDDNEDEEAQDKKGKGRKTKNKEAVDE